MLLSKCVQYYLTNAPLSMNTKTLDWECISYYLWSSTRRQQRGWCKESNAFNKDKKHTSKAVQLDGGQIWIDGLDIASFFVVKK
jgi:hypothetical protein